MDINSLKDFEALVKACRKNGISSMTVGDITFTLAPQHPVMTPYKRRKAAKEAAESPAADPFLSALQQAKANATRAKEGLTASLTQNTPPPEAPSKHTEDTPDDLALLLWSSGGSGDV
jgi:hypothetical protein